MDAESFSQKLSRHLRPGTVCRIRELNAASGTAARLTQMGILPGMVVRVVRASPWGGPLELALDSGQTIALRPSEIHALVCDLIAWPLSTVVHPHGRWRVHAILGNRFQRRRLLSRGLEPGVELELEQLHPFRVRPAGNGESFPINQGDAARLIVEPAEAELHG